MKTDGFNNTFVLFFIKQDLYFGGVRASSR